jgi:molecular chaperone DnaK
LGDKVPADIKTKVEDGIAKVRSVRDQDDPEAINHEVEALMQVLQEVGTAVYQQTQTQPGAEQADPGAQSATGEPHDDGDVVDGEFKQAE